MTSISLSGLPYAGVIPLLKPAGVTSFDCVRDVRRKTGIKKVGHAGTLDPFAEGVLIILLGEATRLQDYFMHIPKVYRAVFKFGVATDTCDSEGAVIKRAARPVDLSAANGRRGQEIKHIIAEKYTGVISQVPPDFSAVKVNGRRAYDLARKGESVALKSKQVTVYYFEVKKIEKDRLEAEIRVSSGTYIRALARDIGRDCGLGAHLVQLLRINGGGVDMAQCVNSAAVTTSKIRDIKEFICDIPFIILTDEDVLEFKAGRLLPYVAGLPADGRYAMLYNDKLVYVLEKKGQKARTLFNLVKYTETCR